MNVVRIWVVLAVFMAAVVPFCVAEAAEEGAVAPPSGFRSLLSGKDLADWQEKGKAPEHWSMQDGTLVFDGKGADLRTVEKFENFIILVDWKVPPNGNSGVFLRDSTQVEINDADKPPRKIWGGTTGGLYPEKPPVKRAAKPAGEWNHYEISAEKGIITVVLNGETTVDHYEKNWGKTKSGPIGLQNHHSQMWFRNIFVKPLPNGEQK